MISLSLFPYVDAELFWRANASALPQALVAAALIMAVLHLLDASVDRETVPPVHKMVLRCAFAFFVPYVVLMAGALPSQMPSEYRRYGTGTYEAGKDIPASSYSVSAGNNEGVPSVVSLRRETPDGPESSSVAWERGTVRVTLYEGDTMTITDGVATYTPSAFDLDPDAPTAGASDGCDFMLAGAHVRPGTYELTAIGDGAEYEVRDSFLETGKPLSPTGFTGMAYVELHYGQVLYVRDAAFQLYANGFGNGPHPDDAAKSTEDPGEEAKGTAPKKEDETSGQGDAAPTSGEKSENPTKAPAAKATAEPEAKPAKTDAAEKPAA